MKKQNRKLKFRGVRYGQLSTVSAEDETSKKNDNKRVR